MIPEDLRRERMGPPRFDPGIAIPIGDETRLAGIRWVRLSKAAYPNQFYANRKSRLTPASGRFPCVYVAATEGTAVAEVWGDTWWYQKQVLKKEIHAIPAKTAEEFAYLVMRPPPSLTLCDFTDEATRLAIGLDGAVLNAADLTIPQAWAEAVATHKNGYDGIVYRSRHTDHPCAVLWARPGVRALDREIAFAAGGPFRDSPAAFETAGKIGIRLSFPFL
ncbi:MAG: RES family NAD+ phosphorylase [Verrucomicrobiae bacterium]|nr:RES family NAD+ phosphorylase [Verrucomicrobiae bacterium]